MCKVNQKHSDSNKLKVIFLQKGLVDTRGWETGELLLNGYQVSV